jgi:dihydrolipoamide dehydrogenase
MTSADFPTENRKYQVVVIGAGPGGFDAAVEAASSGLKVALIEKNLLGGTCLNAGCIPTKLYIGATAPVHDLAAQAKVKVACGEINVDMGKLLTRKDKFIGATRKAMAQKLKALGIDLYQGTAEIIGNNSVKVESPIDTADVEYENLIIATGTHPTSFPGVEPDGEAVLDSTGFLELAEMPESLLVIGAGFIGLEMAQIASRMGSKITVVDAMDRIAVQEDPEVGKTLHSIFKRSKWDIRTGVKVASVKTVDGQAVLETADGETITAGKALVAIGRRPNSKDIGLEKAGIETAGPGYIKVDENLEAAPSIYAIGDINGITLLAHAASHQAGYVVRRIAGEEKGSYAPGPMPSILYGAPEAMRVGSMISELEGKGKVEVSSSPLAANPIAQAYASTQGFVKVVWLDGKVAGVTAVGHHVSSLTTAAAIMVQEEWKREDLNKIIFPHPTLDEALLAALKADRKEIQ